jgi:hypothetical protein
MNWVVFLSCKGSGLDRADLNIFTQAVRAQLAFLERRVEWDLRGNHVAANLCALIVGGVFLRDSDLVERTLKVLASQLAEQILPDGGHFERSPTYHTALLEDLLRVGAAFEQGFGSRPSFLSTAVSRMCTFLETLLIHDAYPLLNDAGTNLAAPPRHLLEYAAQFGWYRPTDQPSTSVFHRHFGLLLSRVGSFTTVFDVGALGPDFLPGHAHDDTLALQLFSDGEPILVDSGTYTYQGPERRYFRSAEAHNVGVIRGLPPSEMWGDFRVGRRGYPTVVSVGESLRTATATHTAYDRVGVRFWRSFVVDESGLYWCDRVENTSAESITADFFLHFGPSVTVAPVGITQEKYEAQLTVDDLMVTILGSGLTVMAFVSPYSAEFGTKVDRPALRISVVATPGRTTVRCAIHRKSSGASPEEGWSQVDSLSQ